MTTSNIINKINPKVGTEKNFYKETRKTWRHDRKIVYPSYRNKFRHIESDTITGKIIKTQLLPFSKEDLS